MYENLIFRAYSSHSLDAVERAFQDKYGQTPSVFVVPKDYIVSGSKANQKKVLVSRFAGFASISVPILLTRDEIMVLDSARVNAPKILEPKEDNQEYDDEGFVLDLGKVRRYCQYCGQKYETDYLEPATHCGKRSCQQQFEEHERRFNTVRAEYSRNGNGNSSQDKDMEENKREPSNVVEEPEAVLAVQIESGTVRDALVFPDPTPMPKKSQVFFDDDFSLDDIYSSSVRGWVYLIESENGLFKIGRSNDVWKRFNEIATMNSVDITLRHAIDAKDYARTELWLHEQFADKRHHGEWFSLLPEDVEWFCNLQDGDLDSV